MAGTSGSSGERAGEVTPSAPQRPLRMCGQRGEYVSKGHVDLAPEQVGDRRRGAL